MNGSPKASRHRFCRSHRPTCASCTTWLQTLLTPGSGNVAIIRGARVVDTGHSTYHLNVLLHTIVNMLHIYTAWVCLCLLLKDSVRCFNLGKEGLDARQNWLRGLSCHCKIQERNIKNIRSMGGAVGEVLRSPKSNFSGGEQILADDEASSFSR